MSKETILIVDDEPDVLKVLKKGLTTGGGYEVLTADNGRDALRIAHDRHPDIMILDVLMGDISGGSVGLTLQEDPETKDIPIIFLSCTFSDRGPLEKGPLFAGHIRLAKPYDMDELLEAVRLHLEKKAVHK